MNNFTEKSRINISLALRISEYGERIFSAEVVRGTSSSEPFLTEPRIRKVVQRSLLQKLLELRSEMRNENIVGSY